MPKRTAKAAAAESGDVPGIDRDSFEPLYHQLASILRQQIATGKLRPGDRIPSEAQLCEQYEVSPMTARRALTALLDEGLATAAPGRGTFVKPLVLTAASFGLDPLERLFDSRRTSVRFLSVRTTPATAQISRKLGVAVDEKVISIRRLLSRDGQPVAYHREYLIFDPERPVVEAEMGITSLQGLFDGAGETVLRSGDLRIQATVLTEEEAGLLSAEAGSAAFRIEHLFYDFEGQALSWGWFIIPGQFLAFDATVGSRPAT
ncbi:MAG: GntR family transcriptional regulator [Anaerolineae bacterium]